MLSGAAVLVAVTGAVAVTVYPTLATSSAEQPTSAVQGPPANTVKVEKGKLSSTVSQDGTLTYQARSDGSPFSAINQARGIYTKLPDEGDKVDCGDVFYRVDDDPVLLLCGTVPAYRDLGRGDKGKDVSQLNWNLRKLGYDADADDNVFTWKTEKALRELQDDKGLDETGELDIDDAVFLPKSVRISKVTGKFGGPAQPGAQVAQATSDTLEVQVGLEASQQGEVKKGDRAQITLPGNKSVTGKVDRLARVAQTAGKDDNAGDATIPTYITLDKPEEARGLDRAPVQVEITAKGVESALSVPVTALVGRSGGGFAVEVVRDGGRRELVAVELGLFDTAKGRVEVKGDLDEGDQVVVPSL
ncbi:efflux RND transporter periplasmic adaptor subunit [Nonomuraea sp. NPDC005983]|uniref:efflux RND transporter periplasmic adaptor subunit n=1 Tax=Nonomuraea sp. NPDC005983 TaxID=3155595 RepID=UPI0033AAAB58